MASEITYQAAAAEAVAPAFAEPSIHPFWPEVVIAFGLGVTAGWVCLLGYWIAKLIEMAI